LNGIGEGMHSKNIISELKKLKVDVRNKIRAIESSDESRSVQILNSLRKDCSVGELIQIEKVIRAIKKDNAALPENFPKTPQTSENFQRLYPLSFDKNLKYINFVIKNNEELLNSYFSLLTTLNESIISKEYEKSDCTVGEIVTKHGYSHLLLRKAILISSSADEMVKLPNIDKLLALAGVDYNNSFVSSLIHCFQEEQDFLNIKKSIMGTFDQGDWNKYTRDIIRIAFHPHAKDKQEFNEFIQSNLQSSLIDAIITIKINSQFLKHGEFKSLDNILKVVEKSSIHINELAKLYVGLDDSETLFYQQSGAWLENGDLVRYRQLQDSFYDSPDSAYINRDDRLMKEVANWVGSKSLSELCSGKSFTSHGFDNLNKIESLGTITRSSVFNYLVHLFEGKLLIAEHELIDLMGKTSSLARTIDVSFIKTLAQIVDSDISKIILYLLIAKKSRNELDNHRLRRLLQNIVLRDYNGQISQFVASMSKVSSAISEYSYDIFTEDFISQLSHIIK